MDKLQMAHEWSMKIIEGNMRAADASDLIERAWQYADAMQAEAEKRNKAEAEQKRKEIREILNDANTFIEREGQHFDDVNECEVDWTVAPSNAEFYLMRYDKAVWSNGFSIICPAPPFGFTGNHIVERPQ